MLIVCENSEVLSQQCGYPHDFEAGARFGQILHDELNKIGILTCPASGQEVFLDAWNGKINEVKSSWLGYTHYNLVYTYDYLTAFEKQQIEEAISEAIFLLHLENTIVENAVS